MLRRVEKILQTSEILQNEQNEQQLQYQKQPHKI